MEIKIIESNYGDEWWFGGSDGMEIQVEDADGLTWVTGGESLKDNPLKLSEARNQAELIKQAIEVCHDTCLTPRQLAEQRAELLGALAAFIAKHDGLDADDGAYVDAVDSLRAVVAKCEANP